MPETPKPQVPAQEMALVDYAERLAKTPLGRLAVHIKLSHLSRANQRAHYIRMATDMFESNVRAVEGRLFVLRNNDIVFIAREPPLTALNKAVDRLQALFAEDPVFEYRTAKGENFCTWYRFDTEYDKFLGACRQILKDAEQAAADYVRPDSTEGMTPIQPELLARLEQALSKTDLTNIVRRQMACTLAPGEPPKALFEEVYVSIRDLQNLATPGVDLLADPWLFQYLTHTLDKRLLAMLIRDGAPQGPFSLNLNVGTVLSPEFRRFDETLAQRPRSRFVIEFNKLDVFSDMGAFLFARDYLRERGFRLCLDGLTHLTLPYYDRARLGFDLIKIHWMPDGIDDILPEMMPIIRKGIMDAGQARTILCRCENARAVETGQQLGIVMFQGRYIDKLFAQSKTAARTG